MVCVHTYSESDNALLRYGYLKFSKMAAGRHLEFDPTGNGAVRSAARSAVPGFSGTADRAAIMDDRLSRRQNACCSDRRSDARSAPINFSFLSFRSPI